MVPPAALQVLREEEHLAGAFCLGVLKRILCAVVSSGWGPFRETRVHRVSRAEYSARTMLGATLPLGSGLGPAAAGRVAPIVSKVTFWISGFRFPPLPPPCVGRSVFWCSFSFIRLHRKILHRRDPSILGAPMFDVRSMRTQEGRKMVLFRLRRIMLLEKSITLTSMRHPTHNFFPSAWRRMEDGELTP